MWRSILIGLAGGSRALTPLAVVGAAARRGALPPDSGAPAWLGAPPVVGVLAALAGAEGLGDKAAWAPHRTVPAGLLARGLSGGLAGAALASRRRAWLGAVLGATAALAGAYVSFGLRARAVRSLGQTASGLAEDALTLAAAWAAVRPAGRRSGWLGD